MAGVRHSQVSERSSWERAGAATQGGKKSRNGFKGADQELALNVRDK